LARTLASDTTVAGNTGDSVSYDAVVKAVSNAKADKLLVVQDNTETAKNGNPVWVTSASQVVKGHSYSAWQLTFDKATTGTNATQPSSFKIGTDTIALNYTSKKAQTQNIDAQDNGVLPTFNFAY
jgi:predicted NAD/FAD-binding protein